MKNLKNLNVFMLYLVYLLDKLPDDEAVTVWNAYCQEIDDPDGEIYEMDDLNWLLEGKSPIEVLDSVSADFDNRNSNYIKIDNMGYWNNVEDVADEIDTNEIARYCVENDVDLDNEEIREVLDSDADEVFTAWICDRADDIINGPEYAWTYKAGEAEEIAKDYQTAGDYMDDSDSENDLCMSQMAEIGNRLERLASICGLWDTFETEGIANLDLDADFPQMVFENTLIKVETTGRNYDFIGTITNKTDQPLKVIATVNGMIDSYERAEIPANGWIGIMADLDGRAVLEYYKYNEDTDTAIEYYQEHFENNERG